MQPLKLHIKVTLLTVAINILALAATVTFITNQVTKIIVKEQKERTELAAITLATETAKEQTPHDAKRIQREAAMVRNARRNFTAVRIYELTDQGLAEIASAEGSSPSETISLEELKQLKQTKTVRKQLGNTSENHRFRVLTPIILPSTKSTVIGVVEVVITLEPTLAVIEEFTNYLLLMTVIAAFITLLLTYLLMRAWVYQPIQKLLLAMQLVESGDLNIQVDPRAPDEIGILSRSFNKMIGELKEITNQLNQQKDSLSAEVRQATQEILALTRKMSQMERLAIAGQTAAQLAHEVGTPLHIISGHVQLIQLRLKDDEKQAKKLEIISEQIRRIETIVREMLARTRLEIKKELLQPNQILKQIYETVIPTAEAQNVELICNLSPNIPNILGDSERLQQALLNLINNALDATKLGGKIELTSYIETINNQVILQVTDTGTGIAPEVVSHIFEPLFTTKEIGKGTGLGLAIVQQVAREQGGQIEFESELAKGSTFKLIFPIATVKQMEKLSVLVE